MLHTNISCLLGDYFGFAGVEAHFCVQMSHGLCLFYFLVGIRPDRPLVESVRSIPLEVVHGLFSI